MKSLFRLLLVVLLCAATATALVWNQRRSGSKSNTSRSTQPADNKETAKKNAAPLKVSAVAVIAEPFAEIVASTGTLRADEGIELQAEINGKIVSISFEEGSPVRKGDLLVKLNDTELRATLGRATSRRDFARHRETRITQLFNEGIANRDEHEAILNEMAVQQAELALIQAQIEKTEIRAPFDGIVGLRAISEGAYVNSATRIATLQRVDPLKLDFSIPERYAGQVEKGATVVFTIAGGIKHYSGQVIAADPRIDSDTRMLRVRARCPNPDGRLRPGGFANVELTLSKLDNAILVPSVAVVPGLTEKNIYVVTDGKAVRRTVETGTRTESSVQILSGLKPGDVVITSGIQQMRAGLPVEPVFNSDPKPSQPQSAEHTGKGTRTTSPRSVTDTSSPNTSASPTSSPASAIPVSTSGGR